MAWKACICRQRSSVLMHGNSLLGVWLTRAAHPAEFGPSADEVSCVALDGWAPAGVVAIATVSAVTATGTSQRSGNRRGRRDIGPTPIPDIENTGIRCNRPMSHTVPYRRRRG